MVTFVQIQKMLLAHGLWKTRLQQTIQTGVNEFSTKDICLDNQCEFGKWLYSMPAADKLKPAWEDVRAIHAEFHRKACKILDLALKRKVQKAAAALDETNYITGKLVGLLTHWALENPREAFRKEKKKSEKGKS